MASLRHLLEVTQHDPVLGWLACHALMPAGKGVNGAHPEEVVEPRQGPWVLNFVKVMHAWSEVWFMGPCMGDGWSEVCRLRDWALELINFHLKHFFGVWRHALRPRWPFIPSG